MPPVPDCIGEKHLSQEPWGLLLIISVMGFLLIGGMLTSLSVYSSVMQPDFHWSEAAMGAGPVALLLGMSTGNLMIAGVMQRLGIRSAYIIGVGVAAFGWISAGFVQGLVQFMSAMALAGFGIGMATIVPGIALISQTFHKRKGLAMALFIGACGFASATMPMLSSELIGALGWHRTFWAMGVVTALACLFLLRKWPRGIKDEPGDSAAQDHAQKRGLGRKETFRLPAYWMLAFALTLSQLCMNGVLFNTIAFLRKGGFDQATAVRIYGIANFMSLPGLMIGGYVSDKVNARLLLPIILLLQAIGTAGLLGIGSPIWNPYAVVVFALIWGGVAGLPAQAGSMLLGEIIGQRAYTAMLGVVFTINGFVGAMAPALVGWAYEKTHGYAWPISMLALFCLLAAAASLFCRSGHEPNGTTFAAPAH
ncbi:MFS transporter [Novosphingobium mathurense]|nr:MFS transporter [Novosphingobium mathurense]